MISIPKILLILLIIFILFILIKLITSIMSLNNTISKPKIKPIIILLDLDRTMIGDIIPQSEEYYIIQNINNELKNLDKKKIPFNFKRLENELRKNIIRPNLLKFLNLSYLKANNLVHKTSYPIL